MAERIHPEVVVRRNVRNQSARVGRIRAIVVHSTESDNRTGPSDLASIAVWFDNPAAQASSHVCTDADGTSGRMVPDARKAWHCSSYNSATLGVEQIGRAAQGAWDRDEIRETARWLAHWSLAHGIPLRVGAVSNGQVTRTGVVTHSMLGAAGGGHHDPGDPYPLSDLIALARHYRALLLDKKRRGR